MNELKEYYSPSYLTKNRFVSLYHQLDEINKIKPSDVLEIGVGNGILPVILKNNGISVTTLDINPKLNPDIHSDIISNELKDNSYSLVSCYEVLEHLQYEKFLPSLKEIHRITKRYALISLPDITFSYRIYAKIPGVFTVDSLLTIPQLTMPAKTITASHFWEIGVKGFHLKRVISDMRNAGFRVIYHFRVKENPYHHFFRLEKIRA